MPKIQAIVFDLYGTLVDIETDEEKNEIFDRLALLLQYYGASINGPKLKEEFNSEKRSYLLNKRERFPEVDLEAVFQSVLRREGIGSLFLAGVCCKLFRILSRQRFQLFLDTIPVLKEIQRRGFPIAMLSNAQRVFTNDEIRLAGLDSFFLYTVLSTDYGFAKPDYRLFAIACAELKVPPANTVYIGDNPDNDVRGARFIGMTTVLISRYNRTVVSGAEPDYYANDLWDAWNWIRTRG